MPYSLSQEALQKHSLNLKQRQHLMMSPQMKQALHLLQAPVAELQCLIEKEMEQNPLLEIVSETEESLETDLAESEDSDEELFENNIGNDNSISEDGLELLLQIEEEHRESMKEMGSSARRTADDEKLQTFIENSVTSKPSLFEYLMVQAAEIFEGEELKMAEILIGNLDEKGFFSSSLGELALLNQFEESKMFDILKKIQNFDPPGVAAGTLQEALLLQLIHLGRANTLGYRIIKDHYEDLLHNRLPVIRKKLKCSYQEIDAAIKDEIGRLDIHPGTQFNKEAVPVIIPDLFVKQEGEKISVCTHEDSIPGLRINRKYLNLLKDEETSAETKDFIRQKIISAKWLMRSLFQRNSTLEKIGIALGEKQKQFFTHPEGKLIPLTMKTVAEELELHESTVARAIANKYLHSPRGTLPLRYFFTNAIESTQGIISSQTVRDILRNLIKSEDKKKPLSDSALAVEIKKRGIACARRTIAKYRSELKIGNACQRKKF